MNINKLVTFVADVNVCVLIAICASIIGLLYRAFDLCIKLLLCKIGVLNRLIVPFAETIWQFCFVAASLTMTSQCLEGNLQSNWILRLDHELTKCKVHDNVTVYGVKTVFTLNAAFLLYDMFNFWYHHGFKHFEFLKKQLFLVIFVTTYYSKCTVFGLSLLFLLNCTKDLELVSKLLFFYAKVTNSSLMWMFSKFFCGVALIPWMYTFFYVYPVFLTHNKSVNSAMMKAEINMLIVLDFLSWVFVAVSVLDSMFAVMMMSYVKPSLERPQSLEYFLFGCCPWYSYLWTRERRHNTILGGDDDDNSLNAARRNTRMLSQVIRCSIVLKRKVSQIRERKRLEEEENVSRKKKTLKQTKDHTI